MKLVYVNDNEEVQINDCVLSLKIEEFNVIGWEFPRRPGGKGLVDVISNNLNGRSFEPFVLRMAFVDSSTLPPVENLRLEMKIVQDQIFNENYFVQRYIEVLANLKMNMDYVTVMRYPRSRCILLAQKFWESLLHDKSIFRPPFDKLYRIAEHIF